jgi:hypothetical protein
MKATIFDFIALNAVLVLTLPLVTSAQSVMFHDPVGFTLAPGSETPVFAKTLPLAECTPNAEGGDPQKGLKLFSDRDGNIHFHVKAPANESAQQTHLARLPLRRVRSTV